MPLKILFTLLLVGLVITRLPEALGRLIGSAVLTGLGSRRGLSR
jgi:hypothetical protein